VAASLTCHSCGTKHFKSTRSPATPAAGKGGIVNAASISIPDSARLGVQGKDQSSAGLPNAEERIFGQVRNVLPLMTCTAASWPLTTTAGANRRSSAKHQLFSLSHLHDVRPKGCHSGIVLSEASDTASEPRVTHTCCVAQALLCILLHISFPALICIVRPAIRWLCWSTGCFDVHSCVVNVDGFCVFVCAAVLCSVLQSCLMPGCWKQSAKSAPLGIIPAEPTCTYHASTELGFTIATVTALERERACCKPCIVYYGCRRATPVRLAERAINSTGQYACGWAIHSTLTPITPLPL
jgi:hypothetical protein